MLKKHFLFFNIDNFVATWYNDSLIKKKEKN